jgi:hypothetical protein
MDVELENVIKVIFPDGIPGMSVPNVYVYINQSQRTLSILIYNNDSV